MKTIRFRKVIKRLIASVKHNVTQCNTQKHTCCDKHDFFSIPKEDVTRQPIKNKERSLKELLASYQLTKHQQVQTRQEMTEIGFD